MTLVPISLAFTEPPTKQSVDGARQALQSTRHSISDLTSQIEAAETALAQIIHDSRKQLNLLHTQRAQLEAQELRTLAYLSPIRKLPSELLRDIFLSYFEHNPKCAWTLSAVCVTWRRLALQTPRLWSKIRLRTTLQASADTIRLWLERSGPSVPLDIEIILRVVKDKSTDVSSARRRRRRSISPLSGPPPAWSVPLTTHNGVGTPYIVAHSVHQSPPIPPVPTVTTIIPVAPTPITVPHTPVFPFSPSPTISDNWSTLSRPLSSEDKSSQVPNGNQNSRTSAHWGHIAVFYLVEQMHRWERFIFRFDKQFASMTALKSLNGDAPLLKEFEISSLEPILYADWPWLPNGTLSTLFSASPVPSLKSLTLHYTPFKWSSPLLHSNLSSLHLRAQPTSHLSLDRILYIVSNNPNLTSLTLHFQGLLNPILPLSSVTLPHLTRLEIGGHYLLTQLVDSLVLPSLNDLNIDIEARDSVEEQIISLVARSGCSHLLEHLSIAYGSSTFSSTFSSLTSSSHPTHGGGPGISTATYYFGPGGIVISWTTLLSELPRLKTLCVGGTPLEPLLTALGPPGDEMHQLESWACLELEKVAMRTCHAHSEGVLKLVQMVEARNPPVGDGSNTGAGSEGAAGASTNTGGNGNTGTNNVMGGSTPQRLKTLELHDCASLGQDVAKWLRDRIENVVCTDLLYDR